MAQLSWRQIKSLLQCIHNVYSCTDVEAFPANTLSSLVKILPSGVATFDEFDLRKKRLINHELPKGFLHPKDFPVVEKYIHEHPLINLLYPNGKQPYAFQQQIELASQKRTPSLQKSALGRAVKISDLLTGSQFQRLALFNEFYKKYGIKHQMLMQVFGNRHVTAAVTFNRDKRDFSEQERLMLNLLGPHITQAYNNAMAIRLLKSKITPRPRAAGRNKPKLTSRESEILFWVAQGKTNGDVAAILNISCGTVRVHLEHIYHKLGVENRTAASILALKELKTKR